ncbi:MAG: hypothetical protein CV045_13905, partial [Cyanobacteria bacterium M5B4]
NGSIKLSDGEITLNITNLLGKKRSEINADSLIGTDLLVKLLEAFYLAQADYNSQKTSKKMQTVNFRVNSPRVTDGAINAQISYEFVINANLLTNNTSAIVQ